MSLRSGYQATGVLRCERVFNGEDEFLKVVVLDRFLLPEMEKFEDGRERSEKRVQKNGGNRKGNEREEAICFYSVKPLLLSTRREKP